MSIETMPTPEKSAETILGSYPFRGWQADLMDQRAAAEREIAELNQAGLERGKRKYGFEAVEWTPESRQRVDELSRQIRRTSQLFNEIELKVQEVRQALFDGADQKGLDTVIERLNLNDYDKFVSEFQREIGEGVAKLLNTISDQNIRRNDKVRIWYVGPNSYEEEAYFSHVDAEIGFVYVSQKKIGNSNVALGGIDVRKVEKIERA
jgi:hypothetical protein